MTPLYDRLKAQDPTALEELGHALLPFVQAALLAPGFALRDSDAVIAAFREEVARAAASASPSGFTGAVVAAMRARSLAAVVPDHAQGEALAKLQALEPLGVAQREVAIARFVERLPADLLGPHYGVDATAIAAILANAAGLLVGPPASGDWTKEASLLDPNAAPTPQFLALENSLSALAIDVTALEREPLRPSGSVPVPVVKAGYEAQAPVEHYPSKIATQASNDLPAEVSSFVAPPPRPSRPSRPSQPSVVVALEHTPPMPAPQLRREESTEPSGKALAVDTSQTVSQLPPVVDTASTRAVLKKVDDESTAVKGQPLVESTEPRARVFHDPDEHTDIGVAVSLPKPFVPLHRRVPPGWYWGSAALCVVFGVGLYVGMVRMVEVRVQRPWTMVPVLVVNRDLEVGTVLSGEMLSIRGIPEQNVSASVVTPEHEPGAIGKRLEFPMQAGDPLLWASLDPSLRNKRFDIIKRGRAYSIPVTDLKSLDGQLVAADEVDLVMTITAIPGRPSLKSTERAVTLLQKVRVLAVGKVTTLNVGRVQKRYTDLTLMLLPQEVEVLGLAMRTGELTASMRNVTDPDMLERGETTIDTLLSGERRRLLEQKRGRVFEIIRGQQK